MSATSTTTAGPTLRLGGRLGTIVVIVVTIVVIAGLAWFVDRSTSGTTAVDLTGDVANAAPAVGQAPPEFSATLVDGTPVSLSDFAGEPVWLVFGASWCGDCRAEAPDIEATWLKYKDAGLVVLAVNVDEDAQAVKDYAARAGLTFPSVPDPDTAVSSRYRVLGTPTHYFIGRDGTIQEIRLGGLQPQDMEQLVAGIMD